MHLYINDTADDVVGFVVVDDFLVDTDFGFIIDFDSVDLDSEALRELYKPEPLAGIWMVGYYTKTT